MASSRIAELIDALAQHRDDFEALLDELDRLLIDEISGEPFAESLEAIPLLIGLLSASSGRLRARLLELLVGFSEDDVFPPLPGPSPPPGAQAPQEPVAPDVTEFATLGFVDGAPVYAEALLDDYPPARAAAAQALARSRRRAEDLRPPLLSRVASEHDDAALAAELLALAALSWRRAGVETHPDTAHRRWDDETARVAAGLLEHPYPACRAAAAATLAFLRPSGVTAPILDALIKAVEEPASIPGRWLWMPTTATDEIALRALRQLPPSTLDSPAIARLARLAAEGRMENPFRLVELLLSAVFAPAPPEPMCFEELNADQEVVVRALADIPPSKQVSQDFGRLSLIAQFGLPAESAVLQAFIAQREPAWRPLSVETRSGQRRWHFFRVWKAALRGDVAPEELVRCLRADLSADEIIPLLGYAGTPDWRIMPDLPDWRTSGSCGLVLPMLARAQSLVLTVFRALSEPGRAALRARVEEVAALARKELALLSVVTVAPGLGAMVAEAYVQHGALPAERDDAFLTAAVSGSAVAEPLRVLVAALPPDRREVVLARARGFSKDGSPFGAWLFWDLCLTAPIVRAIERSVRLPGSRQPTFAELRAQLGAVAETALSLLARADEGALPVIEAFAADPKSSARELFAEALRRLQGNRTP